MKIELPDKSSALSHFFANFHTENPLPVGANHIFSFISSVICPKRFFLSHENNVLYFLNRPKPRIFISHIDILLSLLLFSIGLFLRFVQMHWPPYSLFDESYFGGFVNNYLKQIFFHDVHPPFSRLLMTGFAVFAAYEGDLAFFPPSEQQPGGSPRNFFYYHESAAYYQLRSIPAVFSSSISPMLYFAMRFAGLSASSALMAGLLVLTDTAILIQGRLILTDGLLHFFFATTIALCEFTTTFVPKSKKWICAVLFTAFFFAFAVNTKFTAGGLSVIIVLTLAMEILRTCSLKQLFSVSNALFLVPFVAVPLSLYVSLCYLHTIRGCYHSSDSRKYPSWVTQELRDNLSEPINKTRWIWDSMFYFRFQKILAFPATYLMGEKDDKSSLFYEWPLLRTHWFKFDDKDRTYSCAGQPCLWPVGYFVVICGTVFTIGAFLMGRMTSEFARAAIFLAGFWSSFLPFFFVTRPTYLYHYTLPSIAAICSSVAFLDAVLPPFASSFLATLWVLTSFIGLFLFHPLVYGASRSDVANLCWNRKWC
jgi:dolichyl-phosphate-mannose--protein O-mannosyl transferase